MEDLRRPSYRPRLSSESSFVPIDPFKPSVTYGLKGFMAPVIPRRATTMDDNPQLDRQSAFIFPPDGHIPPLGNNEHIRLPPPHEIPSRPHSTSVTDLPHQVITRPVPRRTQSGFTSTPGWGITDQRTRGSPTPLRSSPISMAENSSIGISDVPLAVIREDGTDADMWEGEPREQDIMPQYSTIENRWQLQGRHNINTTEYLTRAGQHIPQMTTEALRNVSAIKPEKNKQQPRYTPNQSEKESTIESGGSSTHHPLSQTEETNLSTYLLAFIIDTLPRQIYLHLLLRLPYLYFSRVTRIFQDAEMSMPEIKKMALEASNKSNDPATFHHFDTMIMNSSLPYVNLQRSWGLFIDCLLREWKTLNIISVLLLSAILTILQIPSAADDPVTRYTALLSMICALMSLLYGCAFIIRFGTMRTTYKAAEWAEEAQQSKTSIFWNVWVLLAMPTTWLAWSIIMFFVCIMSFVWRTGTTDDVRRGPLTAQDARIPRIIITVVFAVGIIYFVLIARTLRRYGEVMDQAWRSRITAWMHEKVIQVEDTIRHHSRSASPNPRQNRSPGGVRNQPVLSSRHSKDSIESDKSFSSLWIDISIMPPSRPASPLSSLASSQQQEHDLGPDLEPAPFSLSHSLPQLPPITSVDDKTNTSTDFVTGDDQRIGESSCQVTPQINATKLFNVSSNLTPTILPLAQEILTCVLGKEDYEKLALDVHSNSNWIDDDARKTLNVDGIKDVLQRWNDTFFLERGGQIQLCEELFTLDSADIDPVINAGTDTDDGHMVPPLTNRHGVFHFSWRDEMPHDPNCYKLNTWPRGLQRIDILHHLSSVSSAPSAVDSGVGPIPVQDRISLFRIPSTQLPIPDS